MYFHSLPVVHHSSPLSRPLPLSLSHIHTERERGRAGVAESAESVRGSGRQMELHLAGSHSAGAGAPRCSSAVPVQHARFSPLPAPHTPLLAPLTPHPAPADQTPADAPRTPRQNLHMPYVPLAWHHMLINPTPASSHPPIHPPHPTPPYQILAHAGVKVGLCFVSGSGRKMLLSPVSHLCS